jgi:uroporphyrinogen-III decarboxylase
LAEQRLLSIMDYPNEGTRSLARILLAELGSQEGLRILKAEFAAAIAKKEMPSESALAALLRAGFDVVPGLTDLAMAAPDAVSEVSEVAEPLLPLLEKAILAETVPARLKAEVLLLRQGCSDTAEKRLEELRTKHPDPKMRPLIK